MTVLAKIIDPLSEFWRRVGWSVSAFTVPIHNPIVQLENGAFLDLANKRIVIPGDFTIHANGTMRLTSDEHVIIKSGQSFEEREGYVYGIWLNPEEDEQGRPLLRNEELPFAGHITSVEDKTDGPDS